MWRCFLLLRAPALARRWRWLPYFKEALRMCNYLHGSIVPSTFWLLLIFQNKVPLTVGKMSAAIYLVSQVFRSSHFRNFFFLLFPLSSLCLVLFRTCPSALQRISTEEHVVFGFINVWTLQSWSKSIMWAAFIKLRLKQQKEHNLANNTRARFFTY